VHKPMLVHIGQMVQHGERVGVGQVAGVRTIPVLELSRA
jgi:hypothetical protein